MDIGWDVKRLSSAHHRAQCTHVTRRNGCSVHARARYANAAKVRDDAEEDPKAKEAASGSQKPARSAKERRHSSHASEQSLAEQRELCDVLARGFRAYSDGRAGSGTTGGELRADCD